MLPHRTVWCRCAVGLAAATLLFGCSRPNSTTTPPGAVVLVVVDTLRADAIGAYGADDASTPTIDGLAQRGVLFERCLSTSSWTWPSTASLMTGLYPTEHGLVDRSNARIASELPTIAEAFRASGWATAAFVNNPILEGGIGLERGFDVWQGAGGRWADGAHAVESAADWLEGLEDDAPFFLYVHLVEPHSPYRPSEESARLFDVGPPPDDVTEVMSAIQRLASNEPYDVEMVQRFTDWRRGAYAAEVRDADLAIGDLLDRLRSAGRFDDTLIAFTSEHGEEFLEHGLVGHGAQLYAESVHVPLILAGAGLGESGRVRERVENRLLGPTLLRLAGVPRIGGIQPADLTSAEERSLRAAEPALLHLGSGGWFDDDGRLFDERELRGIVLDGVVSVQTRLPSGEVIASHGAFGEEVDSLPDPRARLLRIEEEFARLSRPKSATPLSAEARERLSQFGYALGEPDGD